MIDDEQKGVMQLSSEAQLCHQIGLSSWGISKLKMLTQLEPVNINHYSNLAYLLFSSGAKQHNLQLVQEAAQIQNTAMKLSTTKMLETYVKVAMNMDEYLRSNFPSSCVEGLSTCYSFDQDLIDKLNDGSFACTDLQVSISEVERLSGHPSADTILRARTILSECGVVVIRNTFPSSLIESLAAAQSIQFNDFYKRLEADPTTLATQRSSARGRGRYELKSPMKEPWINRDFIANSFVFPVVNNILGDVSDIELDQFSSITSLAQGYTDMGIYHRDVLALFPDLGASELLPPHGVVMVVPLLNMTKELGPTEFLLKTHLPCKSTELVLHHTGVDVCPLAANSITFIPIANMTDVVLFDVRTIHRGGENRTPLLRPIMYVSYVRGWWRDAVNFVIQRNTKTFDSLAADRRHLLTRIDHEEYILNLEELVEQALGRDRLKRLQSDYKYNALDYSIDSKL
jgi:ectoine hydroxylase-related dioxygenase (phytanoyl-CoA dioxygenase family)